MDAEYTIASTYAPKMEVLSKFWQNIFCVSN